MILNHLQSSKVYNLNGRMIPKAKAQVQGIIHHNLFFKAIQRPYASNHVTNTLIAKKSADNRSNEPLID